MLEANALSVSMGANRNLKLPRFPALIDDLVLIKHSERALVGFGTYSPRLIEGKSIGRLVDHLFPLLDGANTFEQICIAVRGLTPASVADALYFLFTEGLLVEGHGRSVRRQAGAVAFYDRYCGIKGNLVDGRECTQRLATTKALVASGPQQEAITSILRAAGLEAISSVDISTLIDDVSDAAVHATTVRDSGLDMLFMVASDLDALDTIGVATALRRMKKTVLLLDPQSLSIGPLIFGGENGCVHCALARIPTTPKASHPPIELEYAHAMMSARIAMFVGEIIDASLHESTLQIEAETMRWQTTPAYRRSGCPSCAPPASLAAKSVDPTHSSSRLIEFFHLNTQDSAASASKTSHLLSYSPKVIGAVNGAYKSYPLNPRSVTLRPEPEYDIAVDFPERLLQMMSAITCWSHAIGRGANAMSVRSIPSAGNLASQNVYLLTGSGGGRLPAGIHYCHPGGDLVLVSGDDQRHAVANAILEHGPDLQIPVPRAELAAKEHAYIVGTSTLARLESKYQRKAYRFALQDAGVLVSGLMAAAASAGIEAKYVANFFDDQIAEAIKISNAVEIVTFVVRLALESNHDGTN